jgi:hypothetical protein
VDLRVYDKHGQLISERDGGGIDTPLPTTSTYGWTAPVTSGVYLIRTSIMGGVTDYRATLRLSNL